MRRLVSMTDKHKQNVFIFSSLVAGSEEWLKTIAQYCGHYAHISVRMK